MKTDLDSKNTEIDNLKAELAVSTAALLSKTEAITNSSANNEKMEETM